MPQIMFSFGMFLVLQVAVASYQGLVDSESQSSEFVVGEGGCQVKGSCIESPNYPSDYNNNDNCRIFKTSDGLVTAESFSTQEDNDLLTVMHQKFHGNKGPKHFYVQRNSLIKWDTDGAGTKAGWKICNDPIASPPAFVKTSGSCKIRGSCIESPNFPSNYGAGGIGSACKIFKTSSGLVNTHAFSTTWKRDNLRMMGQNFSGSYGPKYLYVTAYSPIVWNALNGGHRGWKICNVPESPSSRFVIGQGQCEVRGSCIESPNYFLDHTGNPSCQIFKTSDGFVSSIAFSVEGGHGTLTVMNRKYFGTRGPQNVYVKAYSPILWHSDGTVGTGWRLCEGSMTTTTTTTTKQSLGKESFIQVGETVAAFEWPTICTGGGIVVITVCVLTVILRRMVTGKANHLEEPMIQA